MDLGPLDRSVTLQRAGAPVDDGHTERPGGFATIPGGADLPATYRPTPGTERFAGGGQAAEAVSVFWIRWSADVADVGPTDRLVDESGRPHDIKSVVELGRRDGLEILGVRAA